MIDDFHDYQKKLDSAKQNIQNHEQITEPNKKLAENYIDWLKLGNQRSPGRLFKYATCLKKILANNPDTNFTQIQDNQEWKQKIQSILLDIQESKYYHSEWAASTKEDYYKVILDLIEFNEISNNPKETSLIPSDFSAYGSRKKKGNGEQHTDPEDIPTPEEAKKFMRKIEENGKPVINLRNNALLALLWDSGARIGEALQTQLKHVEIKNGKIWVEIQGNKNSKDRAIRIFQGSQTLKDWYTQGHPVSEPENNPEAYLFPVMWPKTDTSKPISYRTVTEKVFKKAFNQLETNNEVTCDLAGEPNHIWRKAMTTFYIVNEWAGYDKVLKRQGKSIQNPTLPEYLRMMQSDVDATIAENAGVDYDDSAEEFSSDTARSMKDGDLLPKKCSSCSVINRCYKQFCTSCGTELPDESMPKGSEVDKDGVDEDRLMNLAARVGMKAERNPDKTFEEIKKEVLDQHE